VPLSYKEVAEILKIIDASQCDEVALEMGDIRLVVRRSAGGAPATTGAGKSVASTIRADAPRRTPDKTPAAPAVAPVATHVVAPGRKEIRAPMVGTFYRRPSPRDPAFVEVGQVITRGTPLALIEVMKLYTTIESEIDGVIEQIAAEDGTLVEFDQLLFVVKPA
jgi:acetyl-CoA carboxylase biotin carboxyl carrier protein